MRKKLNPWMNPHILAGIRQRDKLFSQFKRDRKNMMLYREFCKIRNSVQRDIRLAKTNYFKNKISANKNNSSGLWASLKSLGCSKTAKGSQPSIVLESNGRKEFDSGVVADIFNSFYSSVATKLVSLLPVTQNLFSV